jgi:hypothetical protein
MQFITIPSVRITSLEVHNSTKYHLVDVFCLLRCYETWLGGLLPTFRDPWRRNGCFPETSLTNYNPTPRNIPEQRKPAPPRWKPEIWNKNWCFPFFFHIRTVQHLDIITVLFIHQLMHQWVVLKNNIKIYSTIYITTAPTCFGVTVTPSSRSALICACWS